MTRPQATCLFHAVADCGVDLGVPEVLCDKLTRQVMARGTDAPERVAVLESGLVREGWHLSVMALCFGGPVVALYGFRMWSRNGAAR